MPAHSGPGERRLLAEVIAMLTQVTGESAQRLAPASRLEGDLYLDSLDVAALGALLRAAYGDPVDLPAYLAGLDIDEIIALTIGDLVGYVAACLAAAGPATRAGP